MDILMSTLLVFMSFSSGVVIAGGVFAFIASIGIVIRFAQRTKTEKYIRQYENSIIVGGIFGSSTMMVRYFIPIGYIGAVIFALGIGIFVGCMAVSLAEILDVVPILTRRANIVIGLPYYILSIAVGKLAGSLLYYVLPGFYYIS